MGSQPVHKFCILEGEWAFYVPGLIDHLIDQSGAYCFWSVHPSVHLYILSAHLSTNVHNHVCNFPSIQFTVFIFGTHIPWFRQFQMPSALTAGDFDLDLAVSGGGWCLAKFSVKITEKKVTEKS